MKKIWGLILLLTASLLFSACVTQKKKGEDVGWFKKGYHNLTSKYNYWFNADELLRLTTIKQNSQHKDNFSQLLPIYPYMAVDPQPAKGDLDNVIKKASTGIALHRVSDWADDCYTLIGQAQFMKRDFETAEATFKYIREEYNPNTNEKAKIKKSKKKKKESVSKKKKSSSKKKKKSSSKKKKKKSSSKKKKSGSSKSKTDKANAKAKTDDGEKTPEPKPAPEPPKKADKKDDDEEDLPYVRNNPYEKGWQRTAAYPLAMVWYARTLTERDKYDEAEFLLRDLYEDRFFPRKLYDELYVAEANLWIKQKRYDKAIDPLSKAVKLVKNKRERGRLSYILAQLYERAGRYQEAYAAYDLVLRNNPVYELEFNARLRQIQSGWANQQLSSTEANRALERLAKDEKNKEYRDQIYYTLADIALQDGMKKDAVGYLRQSLSFNVNNAAQRAESYLKLGDLYFELEDFVQAKNYYDSTLNVLSNTDERYKRVNDYAANLKEIARLIQTITANDSIVGIYNMDETARLELAKKIKKQREEEAAAQAKKEKTAPAAGAAKAPTPAAGAPSSSFYFYNETFLKKGRKDFGRTWGNRKLEDNWRRSVRPLANAPGEDGAGPDSLRAGVVSDAELKDLFQGIPRTPAELAVLHASTYEAMYQLGTLFRDKLQNNKRCAGTMEDVQARYPDTAKYEKEIWYYAYLSFNDLGNRPKTQYYYDKLVGKYPNSAYARALSDPNFLNATKERERELNNFYEQTYSLFQNGDYRTALDRCVEAPRKYGSTNPLMAKFALLSALCVGNLQGNEAYCQALTDVVGRFPESAEATRAKEIARLLSCKGFEVTEAAKKTTEPPVLDEAFTREDDKLHYFMVALSGDDIRLDDVKNALSDYNREYHKLEQLRISNIFLGTDTNMPILVIRKFDNKEQAMRYFDEVKGRKEFLGETAKKTYNKEFFVITQENYRRVLKNKTLDGYREFFQSNYIK